MKTAMKRLSVALVCGLAGCGGGDDGDRLKGDWVLTAIQGTSCALGFEFDPPRVEQSLLCPLTDGSLALEVTRGTYTKTDTAITLTSTHSSCPGERRETATLEYEFPTSNSLEIRFPDTVVVLTRPGKSTGDEGGSANYGCFTEDGNFVPAPIAPLP